MRRNRYIVLVLLLVTISLNAIRPKIGLILSGGGARGISQIGVLKVLEELGIKPDYITGTSIGSIVGGLYAIGYTADQIEEIVLSQNWPDIFQDRISRENISIEEKDDFDKYISEFPIIRHRISLPKGLVAGQKLSILLSRLTAPVLNIKNFDDFNIPFRCIATDLETGEPVVLKNGYLPDALRASVSIPSIFVPITIDDKVLIDGGISRNLPIIDAKEMGADIIIAIDTGSSLNNRHDLNSFLKIMQQTINFRGIEKGIADRQSADILITPNLKGFQITDFNKSKELIEAGRIAANEKIEELIKIRDEQNLYEPELRSIPLLKIDSLFIHKIRYKGLQNVSKNLVIGKLKIDENSLISYDDLEKGIKRLYGSNYFERVSYKLITKNEGVDLEIRVIESFSNALKFSLYYDQDLNSAIHLNTTFRNFLMEGTRLKIKGKISESPAFHVSYFIHTGWKPGFGIKPYFTYNNYKVPVYGEKSLESKFNHHDTRYGLTFQTIYFHFMTLGIDFNHNISHSKSILSSQETNFDVKRNQFDFFYKLDTIDDFHFPTKGTQVSLTYSDFRNVHTKNQDIDEYPKDFTAYKRFIGKLDKYIPLTGNLSISAQYKVGLLDGELNEIPPDSYIFIGGYNEHNTVVFPFMGLDFMKMNALKAQTLKLATQVNFQHFFYLKGEFDIGETTNMYQKMFFPKNYFYGYGLTLGAKTPIGPLKFTFSQSLEDNEINFYINIGYPY